jgi:hypothetical protein
LELIRPGSRWTLYNKDDDEDYYWASHGRGKGAGVSRWLDEGINLLRKGKLLEAERALRIAVKEDGRSVEAWLWLSQAVESDAEKMICLLKVLELDPRHIVARQKLASLQQRSRVDAGAHVDPFEFEEVVLEDIQKAAAPSDHPFAAVANVDEENNPESNPEIVKEPHDYMKFLVIGLLLMMVVVMIVLLATLFR